MVASGKLFGRDKIGVRIGKVIGKYKVGKHFDLDIQDAALTFSVNEKCVAAEAALDGIYADPHVRRRGRDERRSRRLTNSKRLAEVERAFRTLKGVDLQVRADPPPRWKDASRPISASSMLAYYVQWHLAEAWKPLLFADEAPADEARERDPVAPARRSAAALAKAQTRRLADGSPAFSFRGLLTHLATIVRNTMRPKNAKPDMGILHPHHRG